MFLAAAFRKRTWPTTTPSTQLGRTPFRCAAPGAPQCAAVLQPMGPRVVAVSALFTSKNNARIPETPKLSNRLVCMSQ